MRRATSIVLIFVILFSPILQVILGPTIASAQNATSATVTDNLNLRTQPSLSGRVILVIPRGATVSVRGAADNGFLPVTYNGNAGWAHSDYLALAKPAGTPNETGTITEPLNLRIGPSTGQRVLTVMPAGAIVTITGSSSGGFLSITYGGYSGYAHGDWIKRKTSAPPVKPVPTQAPAKPAPTPTPVTSTGRVTESLNMRSGPNTTSSVIQVMPANATITLNGEKSGDFLGVSYKGRTGWAHRSWIKVTSVTPPAKPKPSPSPAPAPPVTSISGTARVTESLNMRSGPNTTSSVIQVMPAGAKITLTGESSGLFYKVKYSGRTGWAHRDWIEPVAVEVTPTNTARVTQSVNLRGGPATQYSRIVVLPVGAVVTLTGQQSNGFHSVSYNGKSGWAFSTYLDLNAAGQGVPSVSPGSIPAESSPYPAVKTNQGFHYTNSIVGPVRGTPEQAIEYARSSGSLHMDDVEKYIREVYRLAPTLGFDPALIVAQSALETGYWKSKWWDTRLNPAGLGINDDPSTHPYSGKFPNGTIAARAQLAHMHAEVFGNRKSLPRELQGIDVTYEFVFQAGWAGTIVTLEDLSGTWATDPLYGWKISRVAAEIFG